MEYFSGNRIQSEEVLSSSQTGVLRRDSVASDRTVRLIRGHRGDFGHPFGSSPLFQSVESLIRMKVWGSFWLFLEREGDSGPVR